MSEHFEYKSLSEIRTGTNETGISQAQESEAFRSLRRWMLLALSLAVPCVFANLAFSQTATLVAYGTTDIFHSSACYSFPAAPGQSVTFSSVTGLAGFGGPVGGIYSTTGDGADPSLAQTTGVNLPPQGVFSGLQNIPGLVFFLTGVFVGPSTSVPPTINFSGMTNLAQYSPKTNQLFFIGDGLTGTGSGQQQVFHVPAEATGLCLGFGDGAFFSGAPTFSDNWGMLTATFSITNCVKSSDILVKPWLPLSTLDHKPTTMQATFTPTDSRNQPIGLAAEAMACGVDHFNWEQQVDFLPSPSPFIPVNRSEIPDTNNYGGDGSLQAPPSFVDPPPSGYTIGSVAGSAASPLFWDSIQLGGSTMVPCTNDSPIKDSFSLRFQDCPGDDLLALFPGSAVKFTTSLVGVQACPVGSPCPIDGVPAGSFFMWRWQSTFNGHNAGGVSQLKSSLPINPTSGTGGVIVTQLNGEQLNPLMADQISVTSSGLAYSRVTQTFNGTISVKNQTNGDLNGPIQIVLLALPVGTSLANGNGMFSGNPFLTLPVSALGGGQTATISVTFKNSSTAAIVFYPAIYLGRLN